MYVKGILVYFTAFVVLAAVMANRPGDWMIFIDAICLLVLIMVAAGVIIGTGSFKVFIAAVNALFSKRYHISAADKEKAIRLFKLLSMAMIYSAILVTVMSVIMMLLNLDNLQALGPMMAVSLVSIFYGLFANLVFVYPAIFILTSRYNEEERRVISEKQVMDKLMELCHKQGITPEEIMEAHEVYFKKQ